MPFKLTIGREDTEPREIVFDDQDAAIEYAAQWFRGGYSRLILKDEYLSEAVPTDCIRLREDLRNGREFRCARFDERASLAGICTADDHVGAMRPCLAYPSSS